MVNSSLLREQEDMSIQNSPSNFQVTYHLTPQSTLGLLVVGVLYLQFN
jgi:hypothetical protein